MRVRFVGWKGDAKGHYGQAFLTVGAEYVVLSIEARDDEATQFLILDDRTARPGWHAASEFDLVSDEVPSNWRIGVGISGAPGNFRIAPGPWLEPGFFEDYWSDGGVAAIAAQETFRRELELILRENT